MISFKNNTKFGTYRERKKGCLSLSGRSVYKYDYGFVLHWSSIFSSLLWSHALFIFGLKQINGIKEKNLKCFKDKKQTFEKNIFQKIPQTH